MTTSTHYRACNICEAICGLEITVRDGVVEKIQGDKADPFSKGHICPKALALKDLQEDPDRLRKPVRKQGSQWVEIEWDEAIELAADKLVRIADEHGADAVGFYLGNPNVHNHGAMTHQRHLIGQLRTPHIYSATSVDQLAHHVVCHEMYGHQMLVPIPDIDKTDFFLAFGANPLVSNGSMMTAPGMRQRLRALRARGGELHVVDPRRTETAQAADKHYPVRPGSDVYLLAALLECILSEGLAQPLAGERLSGFEQLGELLAPWTAERVASTVGIDADSIRQLARDFAAAQSAVCYGRMGVSTQMHGGLCQWLIQLLNIATGNLDKPGGALVTDPAVDIVRQRLLGRGGFGRSQTRVRAIPGFGGELPSAALAEEITGNDAGRIRALITIAGNPVRSTPAGDQLSRAISSLDFMLAIDHYINETTRQADLILPPTAALEHDHYDYAFLSLATRNVTRYNDAVLDKPQDSLHDWEISHALAQAIATKRQRPMAKLRSPARLLNLALANGPRGYRSGHADALSLKKLRQHPHGLDLGALEPGLLNRLLTQDKKVQCLPDRFRQALITLQLPVGTDPDLPLQLIGRREARSNNSWLHNYPRFVRGNRQCRLMIHPDDASARGLGDGDPVRLRSASGEIQVNIELSDQLRPGVVCLPHGWGHRDEGVRLRVAAELPGASFNDLTGVQELDATTGAAVLNAFAVQVSTA